jgi:hypothetical protein
MTSETPLPTLETRHAGCEGSKSDANQSGQLWEERGTKMKQELCILAVVLSACGTEVPTAIESSDDHGHDTVVALTASDEISTELSTSPAHEADAAFARLSYLHRSPVRTLIEISTSTDGVTWSDWSEGVLSDEASDEEVGVWVADLDVAEGDARYWRVRSTAAEAPTELAVVTETIEELAANLESLDDEAEEEIEAGDETVGVATDALTTNFRRYRFDLGYVGRSWLWLLRGARRRGWDGTLYGPRTGLRTYAQQASLWNAYQNGTGAPAFPPWGPSRHLIRNVGRVGPWYQAVDTSDVGGLISHGRAMGASLRVPYSNEPWHVEARRSFGPPRGWRP